MCPDIGDIINDVASDHRGAGCDLEMAMAGNPVLSVFAYHIHVGSRRGCGKRLRYARWQEVSCVDLKLSDDVDRQPFDDETRTGVHFTDDDTCVTQWPCDGLTVW